MEEINLKVLYFLHKTEITSWKQNRSISFHVLSNCQIQIWRSDFANILMFPIIIHGISKVCSVRHPESFNLLLTCLNKHNLDRNCVQMSLGVIHQKETNCFMRKTYRIFWSFLHISREAGKMDFKLPAVRKNLNPCLPKG